MRSDKSEKNIILGVSSRINSMLIKGYINRHEVAKIDVDMDYLHCYMNYLDSLMFSEKLDLFYNQNK